jgi:hypothetical protein
VACLFIQSVVKQFNSFLFLNKNEIIILFHFWVKLYMSIYVTDANYVMMGISLSNQDLESLKSGLANSCKFRVSAYSSDDKTRDKLRFVARYYVKDEFIYFHVTNTERRKIMKVLKEYY